MSKAERLCIRASMPDARGGAKTRLAGVGAGYRDVFGKTMTFVKFHKAFLDVPLGFCSVKAVITGHQVLDCMPQTKAKNTGICTGLRDAA